jgi:DnaJ domain
VTHYEALGVSTSAGHEEVKRAYRRMARRHHPDVADSDDAVMQRLNQAWAVLGDPAQRLAYDRTLGIGSSNGSRRGARPSAPPPAPPIAVDEMGEADWGPEPEPPPGTKRDLLVFVPLTLLALAAVNVGLGGWFMEGAFLGFAVVLFALALLAFALVPILTLRRQARRSYRA